VLDLWYRLFLCCVGIIERGRRRSSKLQDRGLHEGNTRTTIANQVFFFEFQVHHDLDQKKSLVLVYFLICLRSRKNLREGIPIGGLFPTTKGQTFCTFFVFFFCPFQERNYAKSGMNYSKWHSSTYFYGTMLVEPFPLGFGAF
jgi:hypothetical protein